MAFVRYTSYTHVRVYVYQVYYLYHKNLRAFGAQKDRSF